MTTPASALLGSPRVVGNSGASETPYMTPGVGQPGHNSQGIGQWISGPNAGVVERLQGATAFPSGDAIRHWEHLITIAGTSFYKGGTMVPFVATAIDPVNANLEALWNFDYFYSNDIIVTLQQKFFTDFGSNVPGVRITVVTSLSVASASGLVELVVP